MSFPLSLAVQASLPPLFGPSLQFSDWTSYQALFYFLVIKPSITLFLTIPLLVAVPVSYVLVLPAPMMLRVVRKLGIWQANVAVEGLYLTMS